MIMRQPVYDRSSGLIGLVAVVVDVDSFLQKTGILDEMSPLAMCIADSGGQIFYGDTSVVFSDPVQAKIILPDGEWLFYAVPEGGWGQHLGEESSLLTVFLVAISLLLSGMAYLVVARNAILADTVRGRTRELAQAVSMLEQDIHKREEAERSLRNSESRHVALLEAIPDLMFVLDKDATFLDYKAAADIETLLPLESTRGRKADELLPPDLVRDMLAKLEAAIRTNALQYHEYELFIGGGPRSYEARYKSSGDGNVVVIIRDITDRKMTEKLLHESREHYRQFFESDLTGDFIAGADGRIADCNQAFVRMFGFESRDMVLSSTSDPLFPEGHSRSGFVERIRREKKIEYDEAEYLRRDGSTMYVVQNIIGIFGQDGELKQIRGYIFDDTGRKQLEQQFRESQKFESLGTLAGGIAHDFNNILAIIMGYTSLISERAMTHDDLRRKTEAIMKASSRGAALVDQLLTIARKSDTRRAPVSPNDTVREVTTLLAETIQKTISIVTDLAEDIQPVNADPSQLHQVLLNLCVNARDAMADGGTLSIMTRNVSGDTVRRSDPKAAADAYIHIRVADTGSGMSKETKDRIFEPFFTTKGSTKGSGLGLSMVFGIVRNHGGHIDVRSEPGSGTTFDVFLPASDNSARESIPEPAGESTRTEGTETVLFVEDEDLLRGLVADEFKSVGYSVISAHDGKDALDLYEKNGSTIDVIVSDLDLPRMTGIELFRNIVKVDPSVRFIIASGYVEPEEKKRFLDEGVFQIIGKPYKIPDLLKAVRSSLEAGSIGR